MDKEFSQKMAATGRKVFMLITGGGMMAATESTKHGGASAWFAGASLPYATELSRDYVWEGPLVSANAAEAFAYQADNIHRALCEIPNLMTCVCTAKLTYEGEREGREHYAFIYIIRDGLEMSYKVELSSEMERIEQETYLAMTFCLLILHHATEDEPYTKLETVQLTNPGPTVAT